MNILHVVRPRIQYTLNNILYLFKNNFRYQLYYTSKVEYTLVKYESLRLTYIGLFFLNSPKTNQVRGLFSSSSVVFDIHFIEIYEMHKPATIMLYFSS